MFVRCASCFWYDKDSGECLLLGGYVRFPYMPRRCPYYNMVPRAAINYLKKMTVLVKDNNTDEKDVYSSDPYKNYLRRMFRLVRYDRKD